MPTKNRSEQAAVITGERLMRVLVLAAAKGGVGKSTLSAALAVEAGRQGERVAIADLDSLQCLARWHDARKAESVPWTPILVDRAQEPGEAIAVAREQGCDWLIIDTAPGSLTRVRSAIRAADICVLPLRPSPLDVQSVDALIELCASNARQTLLVLNATELGSKMTTGARSYLIARNLPVWEGAVSYDEGHALAMISGRTAAELVVDGTAATEIGGLWHHITELTSGSSDGLRRRGPTRRKRP